MPPKPQGQLIREIWQGVYGIPGTQEKGLAGDVKEIKDHLSEQNSKINKNTNKIHYIIGVLASLGILSGLGWGIIQLVGG